jgi:hypothetical protein
MAIADVIREGENLRFQWRLVGTHVTEFTGRDVTGRYFDELYGGADHDDLVAAYVWVTKHGQPLRWYGNSHFVEKDWLSMEVIGLPLAADGRTVDKIFCGIFFSRSASPKTQCHSRSMGGVDMGQDRLQIAGYSPSI